MRGPIDCHADPPRVPCRGGACLDNGACLLSVAAPSPPACTPFTIARASVDAVDLVPQHRVVPDLGGFDELVHFVIADTLDAVAEAFDALGARTLSCSDVATHVRRQAEVVRGTIDADPAAIQGLPPEEPRHGNT